MISFRSHSLSFLTLLLLSLTCSSFVLAQRDTTYPACDNTTNAHDYTKSGVGFTWYKTDDPVFYTAPGLGSCGQNYTDQDAVVCLNPGFVNSAYVSTCDVWVQILNTANGVVAQGRVLDTCGAVPNSTFGCNDIYISKELFITLAGSDNTALQNGRLSNPIEWRFALTPCQACQEGLPGNYLNGTVDTCEGYDSQGFLRCGRKQGNQIIPVNDVGQVCNSAITSCDQEEQIAAGITGTGKHPHPHPHPQPHPSVPGSGSGSGGGTGGSGGGNGGGGGGGGSGQGTQNQPNGGHPTVVTGSGGGQTGQNTGATTSSGGHPNVGGR